MGATVLWSNCFGFLLAYFAEASESTQKFEEEKEQKEGKKTQNPKDIESEEISTMRMKA